MVNVVNISNTFTRHRVLVKTFKLHDAVKYQVFNLKTIFSNDYKKTHRALLYHVQTPLFLYA